MSGWPKPWRRGARSRSSWRATSSGPALTDGGAFQASRCSGLRVKSGRGTGRRGARHHTEAPRRPKWQLERGPLSLRQRLLSWKSTLWEMAHCRQQMRPCMTLCPRSFLHLNILIPPLPCPDASPQTAASGRRSANGAAPSPSPEAAPLGGAPDAQENPPVPVDSAAHEARELRELLDETSGSPVSADALRPYSYRLNLMGSDLPHLPLQGPLIIPERGHVFHLSGFAEETRSPDIAGMLPRSIP